MGWGLLIVGLVLAEFGVVYWVWTVRGRVEAERQQVRNHVL